MVRLPCPICRCASATSSARFTSLVESSLTGMMLRDCSKVWCNTWFMIVLLPFPPTNRPDDSAEYYSDFYAYHINTSTWTKLYVDISHPLAANPDIQSVKSRINHSMLYDDVSGKAFRSFISLFFFVRQFFK